MTTEEIVNALATMTNRDEAGRHFTTRYADDVIAELEREELIEITRPVHSTGIPYGQEHWGLEVTEKGIDLVNAYPEYHPEETK